MNWLLGRLRCLRGRHERNGATVYRIDEHDVRGYCAYCGVPMKRLAKRSWIVFRDAA